MQELLDCDISFPLRHELAEASQKYAVGAIRDWLGLGTTSIAQLALTRNCTEGNNNINNGLVTSGFLKPDLDNLVVWDQNHPTNYQAWQYRQSTQNWSDLAIKTISTAMFSQAGGERVFPSDPKSPDDVINPVLNCIDASTRLVTLSWVSNECGLLLPMAEMVGRIREKAKKLDNPGIHVHADSAQTFGALDLRLLQTGVDSITGSFHKWPCGPKMVGIVYMSGQSAAASRFTPNIWGYDEYIYTPEDYGFDPKKGEIDLTAKRFAYLGQQNDATLVATWITALFHTGQFHPNVSPAVIEARVRYLGKLVKEALYRQLPRIYPEFTRATAYKFILTPTTRDDLRSSVFLFRVPDPLGRTKPVDVMNNVYSKYHFAIAAMGDCVRIAPTINNSADDVDEVVTAAVDVIKAMMDGKLPSNSVPRSYS